MGKMTYGAPSLHQPRLQSRPRWAGGWRKLLDLAAITISGRGRKHLNEYVFSLHISAEDYLRHYKGQANTVFVIDRNGKRVRFPASALRRHVDHNGVHGTYRLITDKDNKLISLDRIG